MLILVSSAMSVVVRGSRLLLTSLILIATFTLPSAEIAQAQSASYSGQKSILVKQNEKPVAGSNGSASIDSDQTISTRSTFTARAQEGKSYQFGDDPKPPRQLLVPNTPTEDTYTRPQVAPITVNDLRGGPRVSGSTSTMQSDDFEKNNGPQAVGTFATSKQSWQDQNDLPPVNKSFQPSASSDGPQPDTSYQKLNFGSSNYESSRNPGLSSRSQAPVVASFGSQEPTNATSNFGNQNFTNQGQVGPGYSKPVVAESSVVSSRQQYPSQANQQRNAMAQRPMSSFNRDQSVQPTNYAQPVPKKKVRTDLAKSLMARYSVDNLSGQLPGDPLKLVDLISQPIDISRRQEMVHRYWETYYDWAAYVNAQQYLGWLNQVSAGATSAESGMVEAAQLVAQNRVLAAEIQLGKSQAGMLEFLPGRGTSQLPLPADQPLISRYRTNYDLYKSQRMMPESLRGIDQMLPKTLELISNRAEAAQLSRSAADQVLRGLQGRQTSITSVLEAGRIWRLAERDLIASVTSYNQAIADYALSISQGYQPPDKVVAMLIGKPKPNQAQPQPSSQSRLASQRGMGIVDNGRTGNGRTTNGSTANGRSTGRTINQTSTPGQNYGLGFGAPVNNGSTRNQPGRNLANPMGAGGVGRPPAQQPVGGGQGMGRNPSAQNPSAQGNGGSIYSRARPESGQPGTSNQLNFGASGNGPSINGSFKAPPTSIPTVPPSNGRGGFGPQPTVQGSGAGSNQFGPPIGK
jgi:hypothetical protein